MSKIIIILNTNGLKKLDTYHIIKQKGYDIALVSSTLEDEFSDIVDYYIESNINDCDRLMIDVVEFARTHENIVGIVSFTEFAVEQAAFLAELLNLPTANSKAIKICRNKYLTKSMLRNSSINIPSYKLIRNKSDIKEYMETINKSIIIKPLDAAGAIGVFKLDNPEDIDRVYKSMQFLNHSESYKEIGKEFNEFWIAEEYIKGYEISVESITYEGNTTTIAIHDKMNAVEAPYFLEEFFITPSMRMSTELQDTILSNVKEILEKIGFENGITHIEFRIRDNIPYLIEINPRPGGILVVESTYYSTKINLLEAQIDIVVGKEPMINLNERLPVAFQSITPPLGEIVSMSGVDHAPDSEYIKIFQVKSKVGDYVVNKSATQAVNILACGGEMQEMIQELNKISKQISITSIRKEVSL